MVGNKVLPESSVIDGSFTVGSHVSVQWKDTQLYDANILYSGSEANCDAKIQFVTTSGQLKNDSSLLLEHLQLKNTVPPVVRGIFRTTWHQLSPLPGFMKIHRRLDEIVIRQQSLERKCTRSVHKTCDETAGIIQDLQKRIPRLREPGLLFSSIFVHIYINSPHLDEVTSDEFHHTLLPAAQVENIKKTKSKEIRTSA
uniref:Arrestin_N domain-containing protein n=1 Tax=Heterorhabditis bacteriophora TaxID=37862 RepID=A0A1I7W7A2_HETBA